MELQNKESECYKEVNCGRQKKVKVEKSQGKVVVRGFLSMGLHLEEGKEHGFFSAGTERETDLNIEGPTNTAWIGFEETNTV